METANKPSCLHFFLMPRHIPGTDHVAVLLWKRRARERERKQRVREVSRDLELKTAKLIFQNEEIFSYRARTRNENRS